MLNSSKQDKRIETMASRQEEWIVTDGMGEYVAYYNPTGDVMVFTRSREEARRTTDSHDAYYVARIAQTLYKRRFMKMSMAYED